MMESDLVAISCLIILGVMLTCACSYLCTEGYSLLTKIDEPLNLARRYTRPRTVQNGPTFSGHSNSNAGTRTVGVPAPCIVTQNLSTSTTTTLLTRGREMFQTETPQLSSPPHVPPPPLPPRPRTTILSPWALTLPSAQSRASQMITLEDLRRLEEMNNFQYPPPPRPESLAVHFSNPNRNNSSAAAGPTLQFLRELDNHHQNHNHNSGGRTQRYPGIHRQTIADFGGNQIMWLPALRGPADIEPDLPPTYDEAMEMRVQHTQSVNCEINTEEIN